MQTNEMSVFQCLSFCEEYIFLRKMAILIDHNFLYVEHSRTLLYLNFLIINIQFLIIEYFYSLHISISSCMYFL